MKFRIITTKVILVILIAIVLSSCKDTGVISKEKPEVQNTNINSIESHLKYLTSKECNGRRTGTEGNLKAQKYIKEYLSELDMKPYEQKYEQAFSYDHIYINDISLKIDDKELEYEKDYIVKLFSDEKVFKINEIYNDECDTILLQDGNKPINDEIKVVISKSDEMQKVSLSTYLIANQIYINITEEIYNILEKKDDVKISFSVSYEIKEKEENNIVGIISSGTQNQSAIVLSAHFDHVEGLNGNVFEGAMDNASGTCALLNASKLLRENADENKLKKDIILAFFNFEEAGLNGSKEFAKQLSAKYSDVININFDCINEIDKNCIDITNDNIASKIDLDVLMQKVGISENKRKTMRSDHYSFENGISIGCDDDTIHTLRDVADNIDLESIEKVSEGAADFALSYAYKESEYSNSDEASDQNLKREKIFKEEGKLKLGEYKYIDIDGEIVLVKQNRFYTDDIELIKKEFEFMKVFDEYSKINFFIYFRENDEYNYVTDYELGKVYKKDKSEYENSDFASICFNLSSEDRSESIYFGIQKFYNDTESMLYDYSKEGMGEKVVLSNGQELYSKFSEGMGNILEYFKEEEDFSYTFNFQNIIYDSERKQIDDMDAALKTFEEKDILSICDKFVELFN